MRDPALDRGDHAQAAQLAVHEDRLSASGIRVAIRNAQRDDARRMRRRHKHLEAVARHCGTIRRPPPDPFEALANSEIACRCAGVLYRSDPNLLCVILLRELGFDRNLISQIVGQSEGTISRAPKRAAALCRQRHDRAEVDRDG